MSVVKVVAQVTVRHRETVEVDVAGTPDEITQADVWDALRSSYVEDFDVDDYEVREDE